MMHRRTKRIGQAQKRWGVRPWMGGLALSFPRISFLLLGLLLLGVFLACGLLNKAAKASTGSVIIAPKKSNNLPFFSPQSGLQIAVDTTWAGMEGYRPVRVTLTATKPMTAERLISCKFTLGSRQYENLPCVIERDFSLPQGATSTTQVILVPQLQNRISSKWEVWVDGVKDKDLSSGENFNTQSGNNMSALICDKTSGLSRWSNRPLLQNYLSSYPDESFDMHAVSGSELPDSWLAYSGLSLVAIEASELELLQKEFPDRLSALLRYVRAGGNLWIFSGENSSVELQSIEKFLGIVQNSPDALESLAARGWRYLPLSDTPSIPEAELSQLAQPKDGPQIDLSPSQNAVRQDPARAVDSRHWFVARSYGMGTATVFRTPSRQDQAKTMQAIERSLLSRRLPWDMRHGNDPKTGNSQFYDWLIPDVGTAPVFAFQLLISLFVIGIGPLNYWLLKRSRKLPLLLVTVPIASLAATLLLLAYGFFQDGIGIQLRARSLTLLDQRAGEATCWTRLSYYAGVAPADGLKMPLDTAVYPISPERRSRRSSQHMTDRKEIQWDQHQNLKRGWLGARTPTQYLTIAARPSTKKLQFERQGDDLFVTNHLGVDVISLAVQDEAGNFYSGEKFSMEQRQRLASSDMRIAVAELRTLFAKNQLQFPADFAINRQSVSNRLTWSANLMENRFSSYLSPLANSWENGTYVAVTREGVEVSLGRQDVVESGSFHVIQGSWIP